MQKSMDDAIGEGDTSITYDAHMTKTKSICSDDESLKTMTMMSTESNTETKTTPQATPEVATIGIQLDQKLRERFLSAQTSHDDESLVDRITVNEDGLMALPEMHPEYLNLLRLQLENMELNQWKLQLQRRIQAERAEVVRLKTMLNNQTNAVKVASTQATSADLDADDAAALPDDGSYERIITHYVRENTLLEQKKQILAKEIFDENRELIQLQVELAVRKYQI